MEFAQEAIEQVTARLQPDPAEELKLRLAVLAVVDAIGVALNTWQRSDGRDDLLTLFDEAIEALIQGVTELRGTP